MTRFHITATVLAFVACSRDAAQSVADLRVEDATLVVSTESAILAQPVDIALDDAGVLYVLDYQMAQIVVLPPSGELQRTIGKVGAGPREFDSPMAMTLSGDTVRVIDRGNGRLQTLVVDTDYVRSMPLPAGGGLGPMAVSDDGWLLMATGGTEDALAIYFDETGGRLGALGIPLAEPPAIMDFPSMKREIIEGKVPAMFRNIVRPVFAPAGDMWLILIGEGAVQRYDRDGVLHASARLAGPELERIRSAFIERNRELLNQPGRLHQLTYVADAEVVGETLWVLLNMPVEEEAVMLALTPDGLIERRVLFSRVKGARSFALDADRQRVYFAIPTEASVVAASLPDDVF